MNELESAARARATLTALESRVHSVLSTWSAPLPLRARPPLRARTHDPVRLLRSLEADLAELAARAAEALAVAAERDAESAMWAARARAARLAGRGELVRQAIVRERSAANEAAERRDELARVEAVRIACAGALGILHQEIAARDTGPRS